MTVDHIIKYQTCNLSNSLCRNINDNFTSVSFEIHDNENIQVQIVFSKITQTEEEYIDDIIAEFSALQEKNIVLSPQIRVGQHKALANLVYQKADII